MIRVLGGRLEPDIRDVDPRFARSVCGGDGCDRLALPIPELKPEPMSSSKRKGEAKWAYYPAACTYSDCGFPPRNGARSGRARRGARAVVGFDGFAAHAELHLPECHEAGDEVTNAA
jgi:hypothetical protein